MTTIPLAPIPNQTLSFTENSTQYDLRVFLASNIMCMDLSINGVAILTSARIVAGTPIIPYAYLMNGNFIMSTLNDEIPFYTEFGITQFLVYFSQLELQALANE